MRTKEQARKRKMEKEGTENGNQEPKEIVVHERSSTASMED
jgi:hypothetical protein